MKSWEELYNKNKELDLIFDDRYKHEEKYHKDSIEFLVEFGEFLNETKCFKYWSDKPIKKEEMLEELADIFTMLMYFYNMLNLDFKIKKINVSNIDLLSKINDTYRLGTELYNNLDKETLDNILDNILIIAKELNINENEIKEAIFRKQKIVENRLNMDYRR